MGDFLAYSDEFFSDYDAVESIENDVYQILSTKEDDTLQEED